MFHSWGAAIIATLLSLHGWPVYLLVGAMAFGEGAIALGLILPGETSIFLGGVLAAQGNISLPLLMLVVFLAAVAGDSLGYALGRTWGPAMRRSRMGGWVGEHRWNRAERTLRERGMAAVAIGRWVGMLRALIPAVAGGLGMPYRRFIVASAAGTLLWAPAVAGLGFAAGSAWGQVQGWLGVASVVAISALLGWVVLQWRRGRPERPLHLEPVAPARVPVC